MFRRRTVLSGVLLPLVPACLPAPGAPSTSDPPASAGGGSGGRPASAMGGQTAASGGRGGEGGGPGSGGAGGSSVTESDAASSPTGDSDALAPADATGDDTGPAAEALTRIAFGSCNRLEMNQGFWPQIIARKPQTFLFLGDAIYVDHENTYPQLAGIAGFKTLMAMVRPFVIWDDHDYGGNDTGASYKDKAGAKQRFLKFWANYGAIPATSPRWTREANYDAAIIGPPGKEVQIIMLDNRTDKGTPPAGSVLGMQQWTWLEAELRKPARLRLIMSGMELVSTSTTPEGWGLFKPEQQHFYDVLKSSQAKGVVVLSGDKHYCEISRRDDLGTGYPLYDFTSSPLSAPPEALEANKYRDGADASISDYNFGCITIDWAAPDPTVHIEIVHALKGTMMLERKLTLGGLGG
jgi:alkaline phosphatase D